MKHLLLWYACAIPLGSSLEAMQPLIKQHAEVCCICREDLESTPTTLRCHHEFHTNCLEDYFKTELMGNEKASLKCPLCREVYNKVDLETVVHLEYTADDLFGYLADGIIGSINKESFTLLQELALALLESEEMVDVALEDLCCTEEEISPVLEQLNDFVRDLTLAKLQTQEYREELFQMSFFPTTKKSVKYLLSTNARPLYKFYKASLALPYFGEALQLALSSKAQYVNASLQLLTTLHGTEQLPDNDPLREHLEKIDPLHLVASILGSSLTVRDKETWRAKINDSRKKKIPPRSQRYI